MIKNKFLERIILFLFFFGVFGVNDNSQYNKREIKEEDSN
jgi:hypothetical protein